MAKPFNSNQRKVKLPKSGHEIQEFGGGKKGILVCEDCDAAYYKKFWHHSLLNLKSAKEDVPVNFTLCPACKMIKNRQFEGKVTILNVPEKSSKELINLIKGFCDRAYSRDPLDRLIEIKKLKDSLAVTVTENELANKLGRKIKDAFNKVKVKTSFSAAPSDVALVTVEFLSS